ncbi:MAG: hypothetical protein L3J95_01745 [Thermoplasmata archaeon]|nr:hypothetical protein [Thermoplasmata archaeon]MCI4359136.1 hypothetical protein [Thermoplasmata archaeon]
MRDPESHLEALKLEVAKLDRKLAFRRAVDEMKAKVEQGLMTPEEYRRRVVLLNENPGP